MNRNLPLLLLAALLLSGCGKQAPSSAPPAETVHTTLLIEGMTCEGCVKGITARLSALPGVAAVDVRLAEKRGHIDHDPARTSVAALMAAIKAGGWEASLPDPDEAVADDAGPVEDL